MGFGGLRIKASSILAPNWLVRVKLPLLWGFIDLRTEALFMLGFGRLRIKATSSLVLDWLVRVKLHVPLLWNFIDLRIEALHLAVW